MPRQNPFSKKTSTTYAVVYRPQNDPLIHDESAPSHVFAEVSGPSTSSKPNRKIKQRGDLEEEFGISINGKSLVRDNEGEAAEHGIFYDDSSYDYMQHMRDLGGGGVGNAGKVTWVEAPQTRQERSKGKAKQSLEDALRDASLDDDTYSDTQSLGGLSFATSRTSRSQVSNQESSYQHQQDVPDAIAGFQPDMDPRLREVLEALDDEAYVEDEDDIFAKLTGKGVQELDQDEWEDTLFDDDEGWESDDTTKPAQEYNTTAKDEENLEIPPPATTDGMSHPLTSSGDTPAVIDAETATSTNTVDGDWMASFTKSKGLPATDIPKITNQPDAPASVAPSSLLTTTTNGGVRRKKRKGALTSTTNFSMTSSALARTEPLTLLDSRFDRLAESYMNDDIPSDDDFDDTASMMTTTTNKTGMSRASNMSRMSSASRWSSAGSQAGQGLPAGFDSVMDEFMGGAGKKVKGKKMKKGGTEGFWGQETGMQQLDEIRKGLGPARFKNKV